MTDYADAHDVLNYVRDHWIDMDVQSTREKCDAYAAIDVLVVAKNPNAPEPEGLDDVEIAARQAERRDLVFLTVDHARDLATLDVAMIKADGPPIGTDALGRALLTERALSALWEIARSLYVEAERERLVAKRDAGLL